MLDWKNLVCGVLCAGILVSGMAIPQPVWASGESATEQTQQAEEPEDSGVSKGIQVAGFLVIFTVVFVTTAYVVMRPSLKKLKASQDAAKAKQDTDPK